MASLFHFHEVMPWTLFSHPLNATTSLIQRVILRSSSCAYYFPFELSPMNSVFLVSFPALGGPVVFLTYLPNLGTYYCLWNDFCVRPSFTSYFLFPFMSDSFLIWEGLRFSRTVCLIVSMAPELIEVLGWKEHFDWLLGALEDFLANLEWKVEFWKA